MKKQVLNFRLSEDTVSWLKDMSERTKTSMTSIVETALLDSKTHDKRCMKKEIELEERDTCYHGVPQDSKHFCNKCHKLGYLD